MNRTRMFLMALGLLLMPFCLSQGLAYPEMGAAPKDAAEGPTEAGGVSFQAPASWKRLAPSSAMRLFQYEIASADGKAASAEMVVFFFGTGMGGAIDANIDRWKSQFNPLTEGSGKEIKKETVNGLPVSTVYLEGTYDPGMQGMQEGPQAGYALLGAIVEGPQGPVFFKMYGPHQTIQEAQAGFSELVASFKA